jgi:hypothetical protein
MIMYAEPLDAKQIDRLKETKGKELLAPCWLMVGWVGATNFSKPQQKILVGFSNIGLYMFPTTASGAKILGRHPLRKI